MSEKMSTVGISIEQKDDGYLQFEAIIRARIASLKGPLFTTSASVDGLWEDYLNGFPGESHYGPCLCGADRTGPSAEGHDPKCTARILFPTGKRQHYNCNTCKRFLQKYGTLVRIDKDYASVPILWDDLRDYLPPLFQRSVGLMWQRVECAEVNGVFLFSEEEWGTLYTKGHIWSPQDSQGTRHSIGRTTWSHLSGTPNRNLLFRNPLKSAEQMMAEKRENYLMLCRAISEIPTEAIVQAIRVLEADVVDRGEKTLGIAKWFLDLKTRKDALQGHGRRHNFLWDSVAKAPPGFCHIRSSMIGTLLEDIIKGLPFEEIKRKWDAKMHPLRYQRPIVSTLKEGNIKQANEIISKLGAEGSLSRRFAVLGDVIQCNKVMSAHNGDRHSMDYGWMWMPSMPKEEAMERIRSGTFDHLRTPGTKGRKGQEIKEVVLPPIKITWEKFSKEVLPNAAEITLRVPSSGGFYGLVTAANAEAPPILQWDGLIGVDSEFKALLEERKRLDPEAPDAVVGDVPTFALPRNPCSWYFYHGGSSSTNWNLVAGTHNTDSWTPVTAIFYQPHLWQKAEQFKDKGEDVFFSLEGARDLRHTTGGLFFPESLRSEFHSIRSAMEAYSSKGQIAGKEEGNANGIALSNSSLLLSVLFVKGGTQEYGLSMK